MRKLVVAQMPVSGRDAVVSMLIEDDETVEIYVDSPEEKTAAGDIYVGHVDRVMENAGGAFVRFLPDETGFLPVNRLVGAVFVNPKKDDRLKAGDELIVRIETEKRANKQAVLNAGLKGSREFLANITEKGIHRPYGTCLYKAPRSWKRLYDRYAKDGFARVVTDLPVVKEDLGTKAVLYDDDSIRLYRLYNMAAVLEGFLQKKVWLPGGGYITVEQTEAFVCMDVNSAKACKGKSRDEYLMQINKEALKEAARQLRCRQLSGTILIDLINLKDETAKEELLSFFEGEAKKDSVYTHAVDITPLMIMEITRHKVKKSLQEQVAQVREEGRE